MSSPDRFTESSAVRLPAADGIRALACLWVLVVHNVAIIFPATFAGLTGCGKIGVWLFFVLSAYLLTYKLRNSGITSATLTAYIEGRFWRIIPAFGVAVLVYKFVGTAGINTWGDVCSALLFRKGYAHLWTIPVEFKFYFLLPLFVRLFERIYRGYGMFGCVVAGLVSIALHQCLFPFWKLPDNSIDTRWYISAFLIGVISAFIPRNDSALKATWLGISVLIAVAVMMPFVRQMILGLDPTRYLMNKYLVLSPLWAVFIVTQVEGNGAIGQFLCSRLMVRIGRWSYSIYLFHWFFAIKAHELAPNRIWALAVSILLSLMCGCLMYCAIEIPAKLCRGRVFRRIAELLSLSRKVPISGGHE